MAQGDHPPQRRILFTDEDGLGSFMGVQGKPGRLGGVLRLRCLQVPNHHVGAADGLYLEKVVPDGQVVQYLVKPVQQLHHLQHSLNITAHGFEDANHLLLT